MTHPAPGSARRGRRHRCPVWRDRATATLSRGAVIISAAAAQGRPFTAEELCAVLPCVGRATVYRGLRLLVETEQVCRVLLEDRELRYQLSHQEHHHHMLCAICGASADLVNCDVEDILRAAAARSGFLMSGHWLEVYGRCGDCAD